MTDAHEEEFDTWLTARRDATTAGLAEVLDLGAGLREATLSGRRRAMLGELAQSLDVEGGLAAVLGTGPERGAPPMAPAPPEASGPEPVSRPVPAPPSELPPDVPGFLPGGRWELAARLTPARRLALRDHPARYPAVFAALTAVAVRLLRDIVREKAVRPADVDRTRGLADAVRLASAIDFEAFDHLEVVDRLDEIHSLLEIIVTTVPTGEWKRYAAHARGAALGLARATNSTAYTASHHLEASDEGDRHVRMLEEAESFASLTYKSLDMISGDAGSKPYARHVRRAYDTARAADRDLTRCLAPGLGVIPPPACALELLDPRITDDFTTADLRDADLAPLDLTGVHWSPHGTRWPPTVDVRQLLARSEENPPGSGLYVIRRPTAQDSPFGALV